MQQLLWHHVCFRPQNQHFSVISNYQGSLTFCAMAFDRFKQVKGCCGSILHWDELANATGGWGVHTPHFAVQSCLEMTALPPQQGRNVPEVI